MRIGFVNNTPMVYTPDTPYREPLGGSESGMCYLSEQLVRLGHQVYLFSRIAEPVISRGVSCIPLDRIPNELLASLDVMVVQNTPSSGSPLRPLIGKKAKMVLWLGHGSHQPAVKSLSDQQVQEIFDAFVFVSQWQLDSYLKDFGLDRKKCVILKNAIAPAFENLFLKNEDPFKQKKMPPVLAYASPPARGLDILIDIFPAIRRAVPGTTLKVYSSLGVYQTPQESDQKKHGNLYRRCRETEGVEYSGSIPQPKLAEELRVVSVLAYPNTVAETSCIVVMEAMAAGCQVVTSELGALPETAAGFAKLVPMGTRRKDYGRAFAAETTAVLEDLVTGRTAKISENLVRQIDFVNRHCTWGKRAKQWQDWLGNLAKTRHNF